MKKVTSRFGFFAAAVLVGACFASRAFAGTAVIQFNNVSSYDGVYDGAYSGVYYGTVNGQSATFICDDFVNDITYGQSWDANVNSNQNVGGANNVRYLGSGGTGTYYINNPNLTPGSTYAFQGLPSGGLSQQQEYNMISWLVEQMLNDTNNHDGNWASYAGAIWSTADDGWNNGSGGFNAFYLNQNGGTETAQYFVQEALGHDNDTNLPTYAVYTPNGLSCSGCSNNGQEFFSPVPENWSFTDSLGLFALALAAFGVLTRLGVLRPILQ